MNEKNLTAMMIVCNEECWVRQAVLSVIEFVDKIIIYDTGSRDKTVEIIKKITSPKISLTEFGYVTYKKMVDLRNKQLNECQTDWFLILDGDEVYPPSTISAVQKKLHTMPQKIIGIILRNFLCVGDVWHCLPENFGKYQFGNLKGHYNLRFYRKITGWHWEGEYPNEYYANADKQSLNNLTDFLFYVNEYYWHLSFLPRSLSVPQRNKIKYFLGSKIKKEIPPLLIFSPKRNLEFFWKSILLTPLRWLKNIFQT